ncbi:Outer membrane protein A precursor [hydrothermal vent metagenome]|uniref:Outer membrane protein A n=1 Tax=hydrothermal vent metagenome TaxID=652676 RepID=A0A1W1D3G4_9ZZZZ
MKKLLLLPAVFAGSLIASTPNYEVSALLGYNMTEEEPQRIKSDLLFGSQLQLNKFSYYHIIPELALLYSSTNYDDISSTQVGVFRIGINGVYEYKKFKKTVIPTLKLGMGYSIVSEAKHNTSSSPFTNLGLGVKVPINAQLSFKLEYAYMIDIQTDRYDQNHAFLAGVSYSFSQFFQKKSDFFHLSDDDTSTINIEKETDIEEKTSVKHKAVIEDDDKDGVPNYLDKCTKTPAGVEVDRYGCQMDHDYDMDGVKDSVDKCLYTPEGAEVYSNGCQVDKDSDGDGIKDSRDQCMRTPEGVEVDTFGCRIDKDSDGDGIKDSRDECPNTPKGTKVDTKGCNIVKEKTIPQQFLAPTQEKKKIKHSKYQKLTGLTIKFKYKSFDITDDSKESIDLLTKLLNDNPSYNVKIVGYTDNVGSAKYNKKLSLKRALAIKELLVENGIEEERIQAIGMGEANPIASNATSEGRAKNRRIEIILIK